MLANGRCRFDAVGKRKKTSMSDKGGRPPAAPGARRVNVPLRLPEWLVAWIDSKGATRAQVIEDALVAALNKERGAPVMPNVLVRRDQRP